MTSLQNKKTKAMTYTTPRRSLFLASASLLTVLMATQSQVAFAKDQSEATLIASGNGYAIGAPLQSNQAPTATQNHDIEVRADAVTVAPVLSVGLVDSAYHVLRGKAAHFVSYSNYPSFVTHGEIRVFENGKSTDSAPLAVADVDANGMASWHSNANSPEALFFVYRVYDAHGHFDETVPQELTVIDTPLASANTPHPRPEFGSVDSAKIRNIQLDHSMTVTVTGSADDTKDLVHVAGQIIPVDDAGRFTVQQLIDKNSDHINVSISNGGHEIFSATRALQVRKNNWLFVGQGDLTFLSSTSSGPAVAVSGDTLAAGDHVTSRAAFYAKGNLDGGWKVTGALDTGETLLKDMFRNIDRKDPRQLLRRLNSNQYYSTYGDDSNMVEDAPTQGRFYLKVQQADSSLLVGNFVTTINQAELAQLDRGLFGAIIDHKSIATTSFGERKLQLTAFASDPGTIPGRDEFMGTGGSLYYLKRQDISVGSERVRVETHDRDTGLLLESRELRPQEDYDVDYFQGRIVLKTPLSSSVNDNATVRDGRTNGNVPVLVVRYEYSPAVGDISGYTVGSRGAAWLGDTVRLGVTAQRETSDIADQSLLGADALIRLHAGTYLKAEVAQTTGPAFGQGNSIDGGLTFSDINSPAALGQKARAYRIEGAVDFAEMAGKSGDLGKLAAFYENFDRGFASAGHLTKSDTYRWGASASLPLSSATRVDAKYEELRSADTGTRRVATADFAQKFGKNVEAKLGLRHDDQVAGLLYNSTENGKRTDAALQLNYAPTASNWSLYGFGQMTLQNDSTRQNNDRYGVGAKAEITDRISLAGEVSNGTGGMGADVHLNHRTSEGSETYIGYSLLADRADTGYESANLFTRSNGGTLTVGARHRFNSALNIYGENRIGYSATAPSTMRSFGVKYDPTEQLSFSGTFENGHIDDVSSGIFRRTAASFGVGYSTKKIQLSSNVEARFEKGVGRNQNAWLVRNSASIQVNPDWRAIGRFNFALADDDQHSLRAADYIEGVVGFAYRPVMNDRLNILARYNYFQDMGPIGQITASGQSNSPKQISQIGSIDVNYDLTKEFTLGVKYAYRQGKVSLGRNSDTFISSDTQLAVVRGDLRIVKKWSVLAEGRYLTNDLAGDNRFGALAAIYRDLGNNVKLGAGYSWSEFSDDLSDQSYSSKGFFINLLGKF